MEELSASEFGKCGSKDLRDFKWSNAHFAIAGEGIREFARGRESVAGLGGAISWLRNSLSPQAAIASLVAYDEYVGHATTAVNVNIP